MINKLKLKLYSYKNNKLITFLDKLFYRIQQHRIPEVSGSLVYFSILSLFPFLIALLNTLKLSGVFDSEKLGTMLAYLPKDVSDIALNFFKEIDSNSSGGLLSVSILLGLYTASNGINQVIKNINIAYGFKDTRGFIQSKGLSLIFTVALVIMSILLFLTQVFGELIINSITKFLNIPEVPIIWTVLSTLVPIIYIFFTFVLLYRFSPSSRTREMSSLALTIPGALFATIGIIASTRLFGFYVSNFGKYSITYGSLGGMIVMLVWMWILSNIILIGGEINATLFSMKFFKDTDKWPRHDSVMKSIFRKTE